MELEQCCQGLESTKVTERSKNIKQILSLLQNSNTLQRINDGETCNWDRIIFSSYICLMHDADKYVEDMKKKNSSTVQYDINGRTYFDVVAIAIKEGTDVDFSKLFSYVKAFLDRKIMKQLYGKACLITLKEHILLSPKFRSHLEKDDWIELFTMLKKLCENQQSLSDSNYTQVECLALLVKWGPLYRLPPEVLREEFSFIIEICKSVQQSSLRPHKEIVLNLAYDFCIHTAKDNRSASCYMGEELFLNFQDLYEINVREDRLKIQLIDFFLLQVILHHPKGVENNHAAMYANNWRHWNSYLRSLHWKLCDELNYNMERRNKNTILFIHTNSHQEMRGNFINLFIEVATQVLNKVDNDVGSAASTSHIFDNTAAKRTKSEINTKRLIDNIAETKNWPWVQIIYSLLTVYPKMISEEDYVHLLKILSNLQKECNDQILRYHIYKCLSIMKDRELIIGISATNEKDTIAFWSTIAETTLKEVGLHLCNDVTENLLQKLISHRNIFQYQHILKIFNTTNNFTKSRIQSLYLYGQNFNFPKSENNSIKYGLIKSILNNNSLDKVDYFCCNLTAKVLINLVSKYWFSNENLIIDDSFKSERPHKDISDIYFITFFEDILIQSENNNHKNDQIQLPVIDNELNDFLFETLTNLTNYTLQSYPNDMEVALKVASLMKNIISTYSYCKFCFDDNPALFDNLKNLLTHFTDTFVAISKSDDDNILKKLLCSLELFYSFLTDTKDSFTVKTIIDIVPYDLLKSFFEILNQNSSKSYQSSNDLKFKFTVNTMKVLSAYCFISNDEGITETQFHAFDAITDFEFNNSHEFEYTLSKTFLLEFSSCKPGTFPENHLKVFLDFITNLCKARYHLYDSTVIILEVFKLILEHLKVINSESCLTYMVTLLEPFYTRRNNYGPQISILIIECLDNLCQIDSKFNLLRRWIDNELLITTLSNFLCSDFQEVRFAAIRSISKFFSVQKLEIINIQKDAFKKIFQLSLQVFEIQGSVNSERRIDETVTRSASALQTFANLALSNKIWIQESLFSLIRITHMKKLKGTEKIINLLTKHFGIEHDKLISENIEYILNRWDSFNYSLDSFPFDLCGCESEVAFCIKYVDILPIFLTKCDDNFLNLLSQNFGKDPKDILQEYSPKIFSDCICMEGTTNLKNILNRNTILAGLVRKLGPDLFKQVIKNNIDLVISHLSQSIRDEEHFNINFNKFAVFPVFYGNSLTVKQFEDCLNYIETDICQVDDILKSLTQTDPSRIHKLTLELKLKLSKNEAERLRYFHSYFIIISLITTRLNKRVPFHDYFIKDTINYLLNLMETSEENTKLSFICSHAFYKFITQILPDFSDSILPFFHIIINKLNNLSIRFKDISNCCISILKVIVIEHAQLFSANIKMLDPFPSDTQFKELQRVYLQVRFENRDVPLEKDIEYFLKCGYETKFSDLREEGLKHLCEQLSTKKNELRELYKKLESIRGFSEECENSILHQLICMLVKLTTSKNHDVAIEACKCLGELGPANLTTLILQPEKPVTTQGLTPFELLIGNIISYLLLYTSDANIQLVTAATEGLNNVLNSKEGKMIAKSDKVFINGKINHNYLIPFISSSKQKVNSKLKINENMLITRLNDDAIWCPIYDSSHNDWIVNLVCSLIEIFSESSVLAKLIHVCKLKPEFCEDILPYLIHFILTNTKKESNDFIFGKIRYFFQTHWTSSVEGRYQSADTIVRNKSSVRCMLNCVHYIRLQINYATSQNLTKDKLKLDYLHLAQAAQYCMQYFTAILYAELWCQIKYYEIIEAFSEEQRSRNSRSKMLDVIYENVAPQTGRALEEILRNSYKTLGEFDALHGCGTSLLLDPSRRIEHYKDLGRWDQALLHHEIDVSNNKSDSVKDLVVSLKHCSLYELPILIKQSEEYEYECLWRLGRWNVEEDKHAKNNCNNTDKFEKYRYFALKYLHDDDLNHFKDIVKESRLLEVENIRHTSLESCRNVYTVLSHLQSLREIENFAEIKNTCQNPIQLLKKWKTQDSIMNNDFEYIEPIKTQRIVMLNDNFKNNRQLDKLVDLSLDLAEYARLEGRLTVATRTLSNLRFIGNLSNKELYRIQYKDAQLCWSLNDKTSAHHILRQLSNNEETSPRIRSCSLKQAGKWLIESLSENKNIIISNYLLASLEMFNKRLERNERTQEDVNNIHDTYDVLARYADQEYQHIVEHMNSDVFQLKIKNMKRQKQVANDLKSKSGRRTITEDELRAAKIHEKQSAIDETEIENTEKEKNVLLTFALKYYLLNLINSDENNIRIFRVISLFFENRQNPVITDIINDHLPSLPTYKYITILPQIVPHLSDSNENLFVEHVNQVILKCIKEHPYHTLPLILSLVYANKDRQYTNSTASTSTNESRIAGATKMIKQVKNSDKKLAEIITKMEFLSEAVIQLAYYTAVPTIKNQKQFDIPYAYKIRKVKNFSNVLLPTVTLPVDKSCNYDNIVGIHSFGDKYLKVGGINAPKRVSCRGTDGKVRAQLVKGSDDLRQDAVMQQVFTIINDLLFTNKSTKNLIIRTYKIVPLSMRSGILEWVDDSMPIGEYLVGDPEKGTVGAHVIYRPKDKSPSESRCLFKNAAGYPAKEKLKVYDSICEHFKPVFHKFLEYSFPQPSIYYERRRAYIHSVATTSMCGYILGIGDRHVQNILIDKTTAEVIHIDFGIAFEQGRVLPTPETVPFRLTRDIVDGMGVCGVEGLFRKSCEKTMEVMRQNSQTILGILEVLLYDPLYTWAVTPAEAKRRQKHGQDDSDVIIDCETSGDNISVNITAERALMRLKSKLHGTEDGYPTSLEHQIGTLIQQAQDPSNLCKLFQGWQPYL